MPEHIVSELDVRGPRSTVIGRDLERLYTLYQRALRKVNLTIDEACLIVDALNGSVYDVRSAALLCGAIEDAIKLDRLAEKWGVNGIDLVQKLSGLDELTCMAIVDAAERFWNNERETEFREGVKECFGLQE